MSRKHWEESAETDELAAMGVSRHPGRGYKIFAGLLLVGTATFVAAYYVPLYRAHALLRREYTAVSRESATFRQQLVDAVAALNKTNDECNQLRGELHKQEKGADTLVARAERLERSLQAPLKKFQGKGLLTVERRREKLRITLATPALVAPVGGALTELGKKALCAVGGSLKDSDVHLVVQGLGGGPAEKAVGAWQAAAIRAGNTAQHLTKSCGVEASRIEVAVSSVTSAGDGAAVVLEISPKS
jgi:chemotaxis protein MotB